MSELRVDATHNAASASSPRSRRTSSRQTTDLTAAFDHIFATAARTTRSAATKDSPTPEPSALAAPSSKPAKDDREPTREESPDSPERAKTPEAADSPPAAPRELAQPPAEADLAKPSGEVDLSKRVQAVEPPLQAVSPMVARDERRKTSEQSSPAPAREHAVQQATARHATDAQKRERAPQAASATTSARPEPVKQQAEAPAAVKEQIPQPTTRKTSPSVERATPQLPTAPPAAPTTATRRETKEATPKKRAEVEQSVTANSEPAPRHAKRAESNTAAAQANSKEEVAPERTTSESESAQANSAAQRPDKPNRGARASDEHPQQKPSNPLESIAVKPASDTPATPQTPGHEAAPAKEHSSAETKVAKQAESPRSHVEAAPKATDSQAAQVTESQTEVARTVDPRKAKEPRVASTPTVEAKANVQGHVTASSTPQSPTAVVAAAPVAAAPVALNATQSVTAASTAEVKFEGVKASAKASTPAEAPSTTNGTATPAREREGATLVGAKTTAAKQRPVTDQQQEVERVRLVQRVAKALQTAQDRGGTLRIRLTPPELGALKIELIVRDGALSAKLEAETPAAKTAILENLPALRERLTAQDIKIERFDVDLMQQSDQSGGERQSFTDSESAREQFAERRATWNNERAASKASVTKTETTRTPLVSSGLNVLA